MMIPQIIYIAFTVFVLGFAVARDGERMKDPYVRFWGTLISNVILTGLLYWGGFFRVFQGGH